MRVRRVRNTTFTIILSRLERPSRPEHPSTVWRPKAPPLVTACTRYLYSSICCTYRVVWVGGSVGLKLEVVPSPSFSIWAFTSISLHFDGTTCRWPYTTRHIHAGDAVHLDHYLVAKVLNAANRHRFFDHIGVLIVVSRLPHECQFPNPTEEGIHSGASLTRRSYIK